MPSKKRREQPTVDAAWYRRCLFLSRLQCWEAMLAVYIPYYDRYAEQYPLFFTSSAADGKQWRSLFPKAYWQWYAQNQDKHPHNRKRA